MAEVLLEIYDTSDNRFIHKLQEYVFQFLLFLRVTKLLVIINMVAAIFAQW